MTAVVEDGGTNGTWASGTPVLLEFITEKALLAEVAALCGGLQRVLHRDGHHLYPGAAVELVAAARVGIGGGRAELDVGGKP